MTIDTGPPSARPPSGQSRVGGRRVTRHSTTTQGTPMVHRPLPPQLTKEQSATQRKLNALRDRRATLSDQLVETTAQAKREAAKAVDLGLPITMVAEAAGVHRTVIYQWLGTGKKATSSD